MTNARLIRLKTFCSDWLSKSSTTKKIFVASFLIAMATFGVKIIATFKEILVSYYFGTHDFIDAFLIAYTIPAFFSSVLSSSINAATTSTYVHVLQNEGDVAAHQLANTITKYTVLFICLVCALLLMLTTPLLSLVTTGFSPAKISLVRSLYFILLPSVIFDCLVYVWSGILNAYGKFVWPALFPGIMPLTTLFILVFTGNNLGVYGLAMGVSGGSFLQLTLFALLLNRKISINLFETPRITSAVITIFKQFVPMIFGSLIAYSSTLIDQAMAAALKAGSVASFNYANKIISLPLTIVVTALGVAVVPFASRLVAKKDWVELARVTKHYLIMIFIGTTLLVVLLIMFAQPLTGLIYQRGAFTSADTTNVAAILIALTLQAPFYIGGVFIARILTSLRRNKLLFYVAGVTVISNIVLNVIFMKAYGVVGIALSTSCCYLISFGFNFWLLKRVLHQIGSDKDLNFSG